MRVVIQFAVRWPTVSSRALGRVTPGPSSCSAFVFRLSKGPFALLSRNTECCVPGLKLSTMLLPTHLERVRVAYLAAAALETLDPVPIADLGVKVSLVCAKTWRRGGVASSRLWRPRRPRPQYPHSASDQKSPARRPPDVRPWPDLGPGAQVEGGTRGAEHDERGTLSWLRGNLSTSP